MSTKLRFSDAAMLGSTLLRHVKYQGDGRLTGCVFQTAAASLGIDTINFLPGMFEKFKTLMSSRQICPECGREALFFSVVALHLNDDHRWSIERIADWVRSIEPTPVEDAAPTTISQEVSVAASR